MAEDLIFSPGAIIDVLSWDGYLPGFGDEFTILTWGSDRFGEPTLTYDPWYDTQGIEFIETWNTNSLVLTVVPEPSTLVTLGGLLGMVIICYGWRRRRKR